jgi:biopolymer transport protein ExbB/TolQ
MASNTVWIVVAVIAALIVVGALVWVGRKRQISRRAAQADEIREEVRQEQLKLQHREAIADETAAKARAAQAEAEAKAAEAARLEANAAKHREDAAAHREDLDERASRADSLDPRVKDEERADSVARGDQAGRAQADR